MVLLLTAAWTFGKSMGLVSKARSWTLQQFGLREMLVPMFGVIGQDGNCAAGSSERLLLVLGP